MEISPANLLGRFFNIEVKMARTKFNISKDVQKRKVNNIIFDSKMEADYYSEVLLSQVESGEVIEYELQKPYTLQPKFQHNNMQVQSIVYVADFFIRYKTGEEVVIDVKGCPDNLAKLKRKMFWYRYPEVNYHWVCKSIIDGGWCDYEKVQKARKARKKIKENKEKKDYYE